MTEKFGELLFQRNYADDTITVMGDVPDVIGISEELLVTSDKAFLRKSGDDIWFHVQPEALHYRVIGHRTMEPPYVWIAERVDD